MTLAERWFITMGLELCDKLLEFSEKYLFPNADCEIEFKAGKIVEENFIRREYIIREARMTDINYLLKIEKDCWKEKIRADINEIRNRIIHNACKNFVIEYQEKVVGVLYTQRIHQEDITKVKADNLEEFRASDGECIQLITLNVQKDYQDRGWGYELLEFALEYYSLSPTVNKVYAVTRCRDFLKSKCTTIQEYIKSICVDGNLKDPTLQFHQSHGAKTLGLLKDYRPNDYENQGYGVLIAYDIQHRPWLGKLLKVDKNNNLYSEKLLLNYLEKTLGISIADQNKSLYELGVDSLDFTELLIYMQQKLGIEITYKQLNSKTLKEIIDYCNIQKDRSANLCVSLKKEIHHIMKQYEEVVPLALNGEGPITFWIHPLSGDVGIYNSIADIINESYRMIAIKACGFLSKTKEPLKSVVDMAKYYSKIITSIEPEGPYKIVGYSFGGTIAYEVVRQLQLCGKSVDTLVLIEAPYVDGKDSYLFETDVRNNLLMNANFLLLSLTKKIDYKNLFISENDITNIPTEDLSQQLAVMCKNRGLRHSVEELIFKINSMAEVHISNLYAIQNYEVLPLVDKKIKSYLLRTKEANAISADLWNPDYLEKIQKEKGSFLPLLENWNKEFDGLKTIILDGKNHFDIFHKKDNLYNLNRICKCIFLERPIDIIHIKEEFDKSKKQIMPIAVIGMSGRFPDAANVNEYWDNLRNGRSSIKSFPKERGCDIEEYYDPRKKQPGKTYVRKAGLIDEIDKFDPLFFKLSPNEASYIDPSERIFMEETWKAIEDAGYNPKKISGKLWGVFCCAKGDYSEKIVMEKENEFNNPTNSFAGSRISYFLNLTGPSIFYDTACSSTLAAIEEACNSLVLGNCEVAIAGGGGICSTPSMLISSSQSLLFSTDEKCYSFDERANGTVLGEAIGAVILKPLDKAVEDKNHIYGVICGWGMNQDGKTNGITAPSMMAQMNLQKQIYDKFGISPEDITMVEAHGTGTKLGDTIEFDALNHTFTSYTNKKRFCSLGTAKPNIGHAFFGAGIASVIKVLLSIKNRQIPPMINYEKSNPKIDIDNSPFYITNKLVNWERQDNKPLCCAINAFGATGTNVHLVIKEYIDDTLIQAHEYSDNECAVFFLSAENEEVLHDYAKEYIDAINKKYLSCVDIFNLSYTTKYAREDMKYRLGIVFNSLDDLRKKLEDFEFGISSEAIYFDKSEPMKYLSETSEGNKVILSEDTTTHLTEYIKCWVKGYDVDWSFLYKSKKPRSISLPTYPFAKQSIWFNRDKMKVKVAYTDDLNVFAEVWKEKSIEKKEQFHDETIVIFSLIQENRKSLIEKISLNKKAKVVFISFQDKEISSESNYYILEDCTLNSFRKVFSEIQREYNNINKVVYFWPYEENKYIYKYENIINIIKTIHLEKLQINDVILVGKYQKDIERCYLESWIGFERSLGKMTFKSRVRTVMFEQDELINDDLHLDNLILEINENKNHKSSLYCNRKRHELQIESQQIQFHEDAIKRNGTYLITGGMGQLGYLFATYLAQKYSANLILVGRGVLDTEKEQKVKVLKKMGARVLYYQADVCNKQQMQQVVDQGRSKFGSLDGVIYMAGIANEISILKKSTEEFNKTIEPKTKGIQILNDVLGDSIVDFVCYFSSLAAILGDFGMCDYSVGNRFMMAYASCMRQLYNNGSISRKTVVIGWPLWRDGGMKLKNGNDEEYLKMSGQRFLEAKEGLQCFEQILSEPSKQYFIMTGNKKNILEKVNVENQESEVNYQTMDNRTNETKSIQTKELNEIVLLDLKKIIEDMQGVSINSINEKSYLSDYGFDSISLFDLARNISDYFSIKVSPTSILGYPTISELVDFLILNHKKGLQKYYSSITNFEERNCDNNVEKEENHFHEIPKNELKPQPLNDPIAIIGISGRFPQADNIEEFWEKMSTGKECITEIPESRWKTENASNLKHVKCRYGGFVRGIDEFDPLFFNISPKEAKLMDPCQRLFLEEAWHALEDAGYMGNRIKGKSCGVFVGAEESQYASLVRELGDFDIDQNALLSGRIAYFLDLKGPNMSITSSCSSGLVALHQACQAIKNGECEMALVGGACLISSPIIYEGMNDLEMLSNDGKSYVFDERANGLVPAESIAVIVLKKLSLAISDNDHIYGLIKGSGINYNGRGTGIMTPNPKRESELLEYVLKSSNTTPNEIQHIMTHSSGTPMGDAAEIEGLNLAFSHSDSNFHYIGNIKSLIGHTFAASGIVSLICMLLEIKNNTILGMKNLKTLNDNINVDENRFIFPKENIDWEKDINKPRIGLISTISNSGVNAAAIIEEYISKDEKRYETENEYGRMIFPFQATDSKQLYKVVKTNYVFIKNNMELEFLDIAYSLQIGKEELPERVAFIAHDKNELLNGMLKFIKNNEDGIAIQNSNSIYLGTAFNQMIKSNVLYKYENMILHEILKSKDLEMLCIYWTRGNHVDWLKLHDNKQRNFISLPGYPFRKEKYWYYNKSSDSGKNEIAVSQNSMKNYILEVFAKLLGLECNDIETDKSMMDYGIDSIIVLKFVKEFKKRYNYSLKSSEVMTHITIDSLSDYLDTIVKDNVKESKENVREIIIDAIAKYKAGKMDLDELRYLLKNNESNNN